MYGFSVAEPAEQPSRVSRSVAWAAFFVLIGSGMWGAFTADVPTASMSVQLLLLVKITLAITSGATGAVAMTTGRTGMRSAMMTTTIGLAFVAAVLGFLIAPAI